MKKPFSIALGILMVLLGLAGLLLPIMPGWVFLIPGLIILAEHFHWARRLLAWAKSKAPNWNRKQQNPPSG